MIDMLLICYSSFDDFAKMSIVCNIVHAYINFHLFQGIIKYST